MSRGDFGSRRPKEYNDFESGSEYERLTQQVINNIQQISNNVKVMQKMVNKLGTTEDKIQVQDRLQKTEKTTKSLATETSSMIKQLNYLYSDDPNEQVTFFPWWQKHWRLQYLYTGLNVFMPALAS